MTHNTAWVLDRTITFSTKRCYTQTRQFIYPNIWYQSRWINIRHLL